MLGNLTQEEMEQLLQRNSIGRIGCNDGEATYVVPISYVYEDGILICHSRDGMKISMMRRNPDVCFLVDEIRDYNHWRSVICWGRYEEITEDEEIAYAQQFFSNLMLDQKTVPSALPPHTQQERHHHHRPAYTPTIFYRIRINKATGRFEHGT